MKNKNRTIISEFCLLIVAFIWGAGFIVVKNSLDYISPLWLIAARFSIAAVAISLIFFKKFKLINKKSLLAGIISGIFIYAAFVFQTYGVKYTTASKNALLTASYVVLTPFVFWIMIKSRPRLIQILAAIVCFAGIAMLMYNGSYRSINVGDTMTLLCGLLFAVQISLLGVYSKKHDTVVLTIVQMITCAVISLIAALLFEKAPSQLSGQAIVSMLYLGLLSTCVAYLVQTVAQKYTAPSHASMIMCLESVIGCILSVLIFKDNFTPLMWAGSILTFASVIMSQMSNRNELSKAILSD